ncbi:MAG: hypothetical protein U0556_15785 [Dehalococcoidia bacterium]
MRGWLVLPVAALLIAGCGAPPHTSGGPLGPSAQARKPAPAQAQEPNPANGFEPGQILVKPAPGESLDDLKRKFGADNVQPYRPEGMDENLRIELGLDEWVVIIVPEGSELGALGGLIEDGDVVDSRLVPKGQGQRPI